ncbi:MAG: hypothetical protein HZC41_16355 [Chloroflexi bacterium]|nr:hypothetical protein [Chloroflexota bacterium]
MVYLQRLKALPSPDDLTPAEARYVQEHFDTYAGEVIVNGQAIPWNWINEVEVAKAARAAGPAGWVVRHLVHGDERYHVGLYFGQMEAVLSNVTLNIARHIVQTIAYYAPAPVRYTGPDGLTPLTGS